MEINDKSVLDILKAFGKELVDDLNKSLQNKGFGGPSNGAPQSTSIIGSTKYPVPEMLKGRISLQLYMNDYWYYLEHGRGKTRVGKSKKPFDQSLAGRIYLSGWDVGRINAQEWYKKKLKDPSKSKRLKDYEGLRKSLAYAIAHNIHRKGTIKRFGYRGSNFMSQTLNNGRFEKLSQDLSVVFEKQIVIDITGLFKK